MRGRYGKIEIVRMLEVIETRPQNRGLGVDWLVELFAHDKEFLFHFKASFDVTAYTMNLFVDVDFDNIWDSLGRAFRRNERAKTKYLRGFSGNGIGVRNVKRPKKKTDLWLQFNHTIKQILRGIEAYGSVAEDDIDAAAWAIFYEFWMARGNFLGVDKEGLERWPQDRRVTSSGKLEDAKTFVLRVYGKLIDEGILTQAMLKHNDFRAHQALQSWCSYRGKLMSEFVAPSRFRRSDVEERLGREPTYAEAKGRTKVEITVTELPDGSLRKNYVDDLNVPRLEKAYRAGRTAAWRTRKKRRTAKPGF